MVASGEKVNDEQAVRCAIGVKSQREPGSVVADDVKGANDMAERERRRPVLLAGAYGICRSRTWSPAATSPIASLMRDLGMPFPGEEETTVAPR